ncbi:hypothetical protein TNCV_973411 [Trichonephila clavipes]|nr:hypothetical protein TNCV_973411 [Trichonephila clavipes]
MGNKYVIKIRENKVESYSTSVMKRWKVEGAFLDSKTHSIELVQAKWGGDGSFSLSSSTIELGRSNLRTILRPSSVALK